MEDYTKIFMEEYNNTKSRNKKANKRNRKQVDNITTSDNNSQAPKKIVQKYGKFAYPSEEKRERAIGLRQERNLKVKKYLELVKDLFDPIRIPKPGDWLWEQTEGGGESYTQFSESGYRKTPSERQKTIYLIPIGLFVEGRSPSLDILLNFASTFLCLPVQILPALNISVQGNVGTLTQSANNEGSSSKNNIKQNQFKVTSRMNGNERQLLTKDITKALMKLMPKDAFCIVGLTMWDLYPEESWNFVFGEANMVLGSGIFSFARYDPTFNTKDRFVHTENFKAEDYNELLLQSSQTMIHEIIHLFGIQHCIFYDCCMDDSNHLEENQPLRLCAVDLHKLHKQIKFDFMERDRNLLAFYMSHPAFETEYHFLQNLINHVEQGLNENNDNDGSDKSDKSDENDDNNDK